MSGNISTISTAPKWLVNCYVKQSGANPSELVHRYIINLEKNNRPKQILTIEFVSDESADMKAQMAAHIILLKSMRSTWQFLAPHERDRDQAFSIGREVELAMEEKHSSVIFKENDSANEFFFKEGDSIKEKRGSTNKDSFRKNAAEMGHHLDLAKRLKGENPVTVLERCRTIAESVFQHSALGRPRSCPPSLRNQPQYTIPRARAGTDTKPRTNIPGTTASKPLIRKQRLPQARVQTVQPAAKFRSVTRESVQQKAEQLGQKIDEHIKRMNLDHPIEPVNEAILSPGLPNISASCYMNAALQFIARLSVLDDMLLSNPVQNYAQEQLSVLTGNIYIDSASQNFSKINADLDNLSYKWRHLETCQEKLIHIINAMRRGEAVARSDLQGLFEDLRKCGWNATQGTQADPHELILFMRKIFGVSGYDHCPIHLSSIIVDGSHWHPCDSTPQFELNLILKKEKTISDLIGDHLNQIISDYVPEGGSLVRRDVVQESTFTETPKVLFVQLKRFDNAGNKNSEAVRHIDRFKIFAQKDGESTPKEYEYRLKACISHHGISTTSGHYTTAVRQEVKEKEQWVIYNDNARPTFVPLENKENEKSGYYLAYELEPVRD